MIPKFVVHLLSGGLDSTVLLYHLQSEGCKIHCLLFDYGQKHVQELIWAKHHCHRLKVLFTTVTIPQLRGSSLTDGTGGVVVPARNLVFLSVAANLAASIGADAVTFAANKDDEAQFPDCRTAFVQTFNNMLTTANLPVEICAPFQDKSKWWIAGLGRELGVQFYETWSCYEGGQEPCGKCPACVKREEALK